MAVEYKRICTVCQRRELEDDEPQTCRRCVTVTRGGLVNISILFPLLSVEMHERAGAANLSERRGGAEQPLAFADILSLIGPGSVGRDGVALPSDAPSVASVLASWEDDWRETRGMGAAQCRASVDSASKFLRDNIAWAASRHPAFDEFASEVRSLLGRIQNALQMADTPMVLPADCFDCGGTLVRYYREPSPCRHNGPHSSWCDQGGLSDDAECIDCRARYGPARYLMALSAAIQSRREACQLEHGDDCWNGRSGCSEQRAA